MPILLIAMLDGILPVALLMVFNLAVTVGTLNRLIYYANIIGANSSAFFSGLSPSTKCIYTCIMAKLRSGVDMCFFDGVDTYWKTTSVGFPYVYHTFSYHNDRSFSVSIQ